MIPAWMSSTRAARSFGESSPGLLVGDERVDHRLDIRVRRMLDEVPVRLQRHREAVRHQVVAALRARGCRRRRPGRARPRCARKPRFAALTRSAPRMPVSAAVVPAAISSYERSSVSAPTSAGSSGRSMRSASFAATTSSVVGSMLKSSLPTTRCTGWSANGASRGSSGAASRSTAFGVPRSFDLRFTCELVSCTARVMHAGDDGEVERQLVEDRDVGRGQRVAVGREDAQISPRLAQVERQVLGWRRGSGRAAAPRPRGAASSLVDRRGRLLRCPSARTRSAASGCRSRLGRSLNASTISRPRG